MSDPLARLEPRSLWGHFSAMAAIPRPSRQEEKILGWVRDLAARHGFDCASDSVGNLVIDVPASPGRESAPTVVIQGHLDMVCEKNADVTHDFSTDPIRTVVDGDWVRAEGTTLGADNGIGVAAMLAAATDPEVTHGPLQLLCTIDEETGLTGAAGLDGSLIKGRLLLNLDSEEDGALYVGCAGGADATLTSHPVRRAPAPGRQGVEVEVSGLSGGHSGMNILDGRGNAIKLLARLLDRAREEGIGIEIASIVGGSMHNAIPREARARIAVDPGEVARVEECLAAFGEGVRDELRGIDDGVVLKLNPCDAPEAVLETAASDRLLQLLLVLPHGVLAMSRSIPGLVETSSNLAAISEVDGDLRVVVSMRSSVESALTGVVRSIAAAAALAGAAIDTHDGYPGWTPNMDSPLLEVVRGVYGRIWEGDPEVTAIHAGLECGLLGSKVPGLDMISFGPQIVGAHSPDERVNVPSVARFWRALRDVLDVLSAP